MKTGILSVNGRPKDARVLINKKPVATALPFRVIHLIPGSYQVRVEKDGYHAWEKTLSVYPHETTFATELTLWRATEPTPRAAPLPDKKRLFIPVPPEVAVLMPPNASLVVLGAEERIFLIWDRTGGGMFLATQPFDTQPRPLPSTASEQPSVAWNPDTKQWLIATKSELWLVGTDGAASLIERTSVPIHTAQFLGDRPYILVHRGAVVHIMELDDRDQRSVVTVATGTSIRAVAVNAAITEVVFTDDAGVWTVEIR